MTDVRWDSEVVLMSVQDRRQAEATLSAKMVGSANAATSNAVLHRLLPLAASAAPGTVLVIDLAALEQLDAAGVGVLCTVRSQTRILGGDVALIRVPAWAAPILDEYAPPGDPFACWAP